MNDIQRNALVSGEYPIITQQDLVANISAQYFFAFSNITMVSISNNYLASD